MEINIVKAVVLQSRTSTDKVILHMDMPSALPAVTDQKLSVAFEAEADTGVQYVKDQFHIDSEVINMS